MTFEHTECIHMLRIGNVCLRPTCYARNSSGGSTGGGDKVFTPPPRPLGLPSENVMCIEKRHHVSRPKTVSASSLGQTPPPPPPSKKLDPPLHEVQILWEDIQLILWLNLYLDLK